MSNLIDKQREVGNQLPAETTLTDLITEVNNLKTILNYIIELIKTRNF